MNEFIHFLIIIEFRNHLLKRQTNMNRNVVMLPHRNVDRVLHGDILNGWNRRLLQVLFVNIESSLKIKIEKHNRKYFGIDGWQFDIRQRLVQTIQTTNRQEEARGKHIASVGDNIRRQTDANQRAYTGGDGALTAFFCSNIAHIGGTNESIANACTRCRSSQPRDVLS